MCVCVLGVAELFVYAQLCCCKLCCIATNLSFVSMLAMEAMDNVRAKAKAKAKNNAEPGLKKRRLTPNACCR